MTFDQYRALPGLNWSVLKKYAKSPAAAKYAETHPTEPTAAMALGTAVHTLILEPHRASSIVIYPEARRGKAWDAFEIANAGKTILSESEFDTAMAMQRSVRTHPRLAPYLAGNAETTIEFSLDGVACKARPDMVCAAGAVVDLKTTRDASAEAFGRDAFNMGYLGQAYFYQQAVKSRTGHDMPFAFLAVEKEPPYPCALYIVSDEAMAWAKAEVERLLAVYKACEAAQSWSGYEEIQFLKLPRWSGIHGESDNG